MAVRVFVSSTWEDLKPERKAVENYLHRMQDTDFVGMEYFGSRPDTTREESLNEVSHSNIYIGIFAHRYGSGITAEEYRKAREIEIPCLIYFKDEEEPVKPRYVETDPAKKTKLDALKNEIRENHTISGFRSPDNLAAQVVTDLHRLLNSGRLASQPSRTQKRPENQYEAYMETGLLELEQGSLFVAEQNFKLGLEESRKPDSEASSGPPILKLAEVNHADSKYESAEVLFRQAIEIFEGESNTAETINAKMGLAHLYLDWEKYEGVAKTENATKLLDTIDIAALSPVQKAELKFTEGEILIYQGRYPKAANILCEALDVVDKKSPLHLHIKKARAYALFRNDDFNGAKKEYEEALQIAPPHEKMLIYQDLMFMEYGLGNITPSYRERRQRTRKEIDNEYIRIERYHSIALSYLAKKDYRRAYTYMVREHRLYRRVGNLFDYGFVNNLASLFSESQEYEKALECYIRLGETDKIEHISNSIVENIVPDQVAKVFTDLLEKLSKKASVMEKTGVASALGNLYEILPDELRDNTVEKLLELAGDEYNFIRNRDVKRTALKSLEKYIRHRIIPEGLVSKVADNLVEFSEHEIPFVREHVAKCFNALLDMVPENAQENVYEHLSKWYKIEEHYRVKEVLEICITNLAYYFKSPWKESLKSILREEVIGKASTEQLSYLALLGEDIPRGRVEFALKGIIKNLDIQANYSATVNKSLYDGLHHLTYIKEYIPDEFKGSLVEKMISALENKHNLIDNKRQITMAIAEIVTEFDCSIQDKLWDALISIVNTGFDELDSAKRDRDYTAIFASLEESIGDSIYALAKIYEISKTDERKKALKLLLLQAASSKHVEIRKSAAHGLRFLEELELESQLTVFSLLFDVDDVAAQAVQSVAELSDRIWDETVFKKILEKLVLNTDSESLDIKIATAYTLNQLLDRSDLSDTLREQIQHAREKLTRDKFYRVRREASYTEEL